MILFTIRTRKPVR